MAHTPGPWTVGGQSDNTGEAEEICAASRVIAWTADTYDEDDDDGHITAEDRSNARLIAAAPDLLRLVRRLREVFEQLSDGDWRHMDATYVDQLIESDGLRACAQAIAKAEGRADEN